MTTVTQATNSVPPEIAQARDLYRAGQADESRECLCRFLLAVPGNIDALLWLARASSDQDEAAAAAQIALSLEPTNEVAQRAVAEREKRHVTPMALAKARAVKWPFRGINRPIGPALEEGLIQLRDLVYAVENAKDPQVRDAARTVLVTQLVDVELPAPPRPLTVISQGRYLEGEERRHYSVAALGLGALTTLFVLSLLAAVTLIVGKAFFAWEYLWWLDLIPVALLVSASLTISQVERGIDTADNFRTGRWGEEDTVDAMRTTLDGHWTLIKNWQFPNYKWGDVDLVLAGPGGVWAFEVKGYSGWVRNVGDRWEYRAGQRWKKVDKHPGKQARRNAKRLQEYLAASGAPIKYVEPVIILANRDGKLSLSEPTTPVWTLDQVADRAGSLQSRRPLSDEQVEQVMSILSRTLKSAL